jgi:hypothetical protein
VSGVDKRRTQSAAQAGLDWSHILSSASIEYQSAQHNVTSGVELMAEPDMGVWDGVDGSVTFVVTQPCEVAEAPENALSAPVCSVQYFLWDDELARQQSAQPQSIGADSKVVIVERLPLDFSSKVRLVLCLSAFHYPWYTFLYFCHHAQSPSLEPLVVRLRRHTVFNALLASCAPHVPPQSLQCVFQGAGGLETGTSQMRWNEICQLGPMCFGALPMSDSPTGTSPISLFP